MRAVGCYGSLCYRYLVGANGIEPPTPTMSRWCSNQLSYAPVAKANYTRNGLFSASIEGAASQKTVHHFCDGM